MTVENLDIQISQSGYAASQQMDRLASSIRQIKAPTASVSKGVKKLSDSFGIGSTAVGKFVKSLGRIAFYRAIRTVVKEITQSFKEGLQNAYQFSKGLNGGLAAALDGISTKALTMKNQLGSAFGGLLQAIQPILLRIISLITQAANAIAAFFGALNGGTYLKAKDTATAWNEATGAANKYKNTILGFDEINKLDDSSGGGGGGINANDMFEEVPAQLPPWLQKIIDGIPKEAIENLKSAVDNLKESWKNLMDSPAIQSFKDFLGWLASADATVRINLITAAFNDIADTLNLINAILNGDWKKALEITIDVVSDPANVLRLLGLVGGTMIGGPAGAVIGYTIAVTLDTFINGMKTKNAEVSLYEVYPFLSDNWIAQKFKQARVSLTVAYQRNIVPLFKYGNWKILLKETGEELNNLWDTLVVNPFLNFLDTDKRIGEKLDEFFTRDLPALWEDLRMFWVVSRAKLIIWKDQTLRHIAEWKNTAKEQFKQHAGEIIDGVLEKLKERWEQIVSWFQTAWQNLKNWWNGLSLGSLTVRTPNINIPIGKNKADMYASGGFPSRGELFIAGEAGAEIVSSHNGQTQVSNTDQIANSVLQGNSVVVSAIDAMADAVVRAIANKNTNVYLDSKEIRNGQNRLSRAMG